MPKRRRKDEDDGEAPEELVARTGVVRSDHVGSVEFLDERSLDELLPNRDRRRWR